MAGFLFGRHFYSAVIPAKAGIQWRSSRYRKPPKDP